MLLLAVTATACADDATPPSNGGVYTAVLTAPTGQQFNGGALVELNGAGIDSITPTYGEVFTQREGNAVRVAVVADRGQLSFRVHLADDSRLPTVNILEVSDGEDALRSSLEGFRLEFRQ